MRIKRQIGNIATIIGLASAFYLSGCSKNTRYNVKTDCSYADNYSVGVQNVDDRTYVRIGTLFNPKSPSQGFKEYILGLDNDGDGWIEKVEDHAKRGSPLEELASINKVNEILEDFIQDKN